MRKYLSLLFALCLVVSLLVPIFTMAEELDSSNSVSEATATPSGDVSPSPSDSAAPSPSNSTAPNPSDSVPPSPLDSVPPSPLDSAAPSPSDSVAPSPSDSVAPSPSAKVIDAEALYNTLMSIADGDEAIKYLESLSKEELLALENYMKALEPEYAEPPETVSMTDAGPLLSNFSSEKKVQQTAQIMRLMSARLMCQSDNTDDVKLTKKATPNANGTYTIQLESYTTGKVTTHTTGAPADIVLVLDQSGSMSQSFSGGISRQTALKSSVTEFIDKISDTGVNHRIAIVSFGTSANLTSGFSNSYNDLITTVNSLSAPSGSTNVAAGMTIAYSQLSNPSLSTNANKVVIVFTDGVPTTGSDFDTDMADKAIKTARSIKDLGATVYTIGIFGGADSSQLYGSKKFLHNSDGTNGSYWSGLRVLFWGDVTTVSVPAGNRFLNYLSSEYTNATGFDLSRMGFNIGLLEYEKFTIIKDPINPTSLKNYYLSAADSGKLTEAFTKISEQIATPDAPLGNNASVRDVISEYFDMPTTGIRVSTVACTGKTDDGYTWSENEMPLIGEQISSDANLKTISVSGFNYDEQFVTTEEKPGGGYGSKLVISFEITPRGDFWGGNQVPTNTVASGLYAGNNLVKNFDVPTVNVPINVSLTARDISIYLGNTVAIGDLYNPITAPTGADEWKGHFIDVGGITYSASFDAKPTGDLSPVTVTATVRSRNIPELGATSVQSNASITVYKPEITFCDSSIYLGEKAEYTGNLVSVSWKHGTTVADPANILGATPTLTYSYGPPAGWIEDDTAVDVTVNIGDWDITQHVTFTNNGSSHAGSAVDKEFTVRVTPCTLTVSKIGCNGAYGDNQTFILHITGTNLAGCDFADEVNLNVVVNGNSSKTIVGLPVGNYTVTENSGWSWRYTANTGTATLSPIRTESTISVTNSLTELGKLWLSGSNWMQNVFNKKAGVSA